jgi:sugar phosphate isomerase/epimerase
MSEFQTGFVTTSRLGWRESIELADELDLDFVELWLDGATAPQAIDGETDAIADEATEAGLDLLCHLPFPLDIGSPYPDVRRGSVDVLKQSVRVAADIGARKGVVHPRSFAYGNAWPDEDIREHVYDSLTVLHEYGADRGVELCPENLFESRFTLDDFDELLSSTPTDMTLDTGHARVAGVSDTALVDFVSGHADRISHIHLNESRHAADEHLPIGMGDMPFEALFDRLRDADWSGTVSMEVMAADDDYLSVSKQKLEALC